MRKCAPEREKEVRAIFEARPFGELERLVTQKLLDVAKRIAKEELESDNWLHLVARMSGRSYGEMRVTILEFLDTDIFNISVENCVSFLDPLIDSWDVDLATFAIEIILNKRLAPGDPKKFEFVEMEAGQSAGGGTRAKRISGESLTQCERHAGRNRFSEEIEVPWEAAHCALLLQGIAEP